MKFHGVIPPLTTPFDSEGRLQLDSLERNVEKYLATRLAGLLALGSNGEAVHLDAKERLEVVQTVAGMVPQDRIFLVGISSATLQQALKFVESLNRFRIDALLVSVPSYYKNRMNRQALLEFFVGLAEDSPFPVLLYNVPQYSGLEIPPALVRELASHPRIIGMKDSSGNLQYVQRVLGLTEGEDFQIIMGSAQVLGPSLTLGIRAGILAVGCAIPELPIGVIDAFDQEGTIKERQLELFRFANAVTSDYGVPGLKYAMDLCGYEGKWCRRPLLPPSPEEQAAIRTVVESLHVKS